MRGAGMTAAELLESNDRDALLDWMEHQLRGDWYTSDLLRLALRADTNNLKKLMEVYPDEIGCAFWYKSGINPVKAAEAQAQWAKEHYEVEHP